MKFSDHTALRREYDLVLSKAGYSHIFGAVNDETRLYRTVERSEFLEYITRSAYAASVIHRSNVRPSVSLSVAYDREPRKCKNG